MSQSFPGHVFVPPTGGPAVQQPQRQRVTAKSVTDPTTRTTYQVAAMSTPPASYVFVVTRVTITAQVVSVPSVTLTPTTLPYAVVGPALLRLDGQEIDSTDDGSDDTWTGQIIISPGSVLDVMWPNLPGDAGDNDNTATAVFEFLQVSA